MSKCYILGAGASYGYDDGLANAQRFPLTDEFFSKGSALGLFNDTNFPELTKYLKLYLKDQNLPLDQNRCDVEAFLGWLCEQTEKQEKDSNTAILALGECYFYIYELLRQLCVTYYPKNDNYRRLALHYFDECYCVISLNYDLLFEMAIESVGLSYYYSESYPSPLKSIKLMKLHGSINWFNQMFGIGTNLIVTQKRDVLYNTVKSHIPFTRFQMKNIQILNGNEIRSLNYKDLAVNGYKCYEPVIIPPLYNYKDYEKVKQYDELWTSAKKELELADEIIIIGCSIRSQDVKINELLANTINEKKSVIICSPDSEKVKTRIPNIGKVNDIKIFSSFTQYVKNL